MRFTPVSHVGAVLTLALVATACDDASDQPFDDGAGNPKEVGGKAEAWGSQDDPNIFDDDLEFRYATLPKSGEASVTPWAANYWPTFQDNINYRWAGPDTDSPAKKYGDAFGVTGVEDAVSRYHGIDSRTNATVCTDDAQCNTDLGEACSIRNDETEGRCIPTWFGICHAWAPAALMYAEPEHPVTYNGVTFEINDIKGLLTLANNRVDSKFVSLRCNEHLDDIDLDAYGRPTDRRCRYTNPASYHVLLANYLGLRGQGFVEDRTFSAEVWNQPIRGFEILDERPLTVVEANQLIGVSADAETVDESGSVAEGAWEYFGPFPVGEGDSVNVEMTGNNDADLYVHFGDQPSGQDYACRPYTSNSNENCSLTAPAGVDSFYVAVAGYAPSSDYALSVSYGSVPSTYHFNQDAVELVYVKTEVDWIAESPAHVDGNLSDDIDRYTHQDVYEYVLEIDASGDLIGGEWIGESKTQHPDFLWLPTGLSQNSVAGGAITWDNVRTIYEMSLDRTGFETINESGSIAQNEWQHFGPFRGSDFSASMTGTGDADLYVREGAQPTSGDFDCRPYTGGSIESCSDNESGEYYVSVYGYAASDFDLTIQYNVQ